MNNNYQDLINKKIDGLLSEDEKRLLDKIVSEDKQAAKYHNDMIHALQQLNDIEAPEPPANLKKYVMNAIDVNKYARPRNKRAQFINAISSYMPRPGLAAAFALGLLAGIFVVLVYIMQTNNDALSLRDIQGTIGLNHAAQLDIVTVLPVDYDKISGEIIVAQSRYNIVIENKIKQNEYGELILEFDANTIRFTDFRPQDEARTSLEWGRGFVKIKGEKNNLSQLILEKKAYGTHWVNIKFNTSSGTILDKKISL